MAKSILTGVKVAVTRPAKQAGALCQLIEAQGGQSILFPTLEILEPESSAQLTSLLSKLDQFDTAVFVSVNAVEWAAHYIVQTLPDSLTLAAIGKSTAIAIEKQWQRQAIRPESGANSEALLASPEMQHIENRKIIIFRGQGGRELLADTLRQRGATVEYAEVYRRAKPHQDLSALQAQSPIDIITATSNESLQNLNDMAGETFRDWLLKLPLVVISQRSAKLAQTLGFHQPAIIAEDASDQGLLDAIIHWQTAQ